MPQVLLSLLATLSCAQAFAQDPYDNIPEGNRFEATAFLGYRIGGTFDIESSDENGDVAEHISYGVVLDYRVDAGAYEFFYSRQPTHVSLGPESFDLDVQYFMLGGVLPFEYESRWRPYLIGLIGVARLSPDAPDAHDETRFALTIGVGVRVPFRDRFDIRLEARGYMTFFDTNTSVFCESDATGSFCRLKGNGHVFLQGELLAGIAYSF